MRRIGRWFNRVSPSLRRTSGLALVALLVLGFQRQASAMEIGVGGGMVNFDDDTELSTSPLLALRWGKGAGIFGGETALSIGRVGKSMPTDVREKLEGFVESNVTVIFYEGRFFLGIPTANKLHPFGGVGMGAMTMTSAEVPRETDQMLGATLDALGKARTKFMISYGAGAKYDLSEKVGFRVEWRNYLVPSVEVTNTEEIVRAAAEGKSAEDIASRGVTNTTVTHVEISGGLVFRF